MKRLHLIGKVGFTLGLALLGACGGREARQEPTGATSPAASRKAITIKGSDTMVILGQRFAEEYMKRHPGAVIQVNGGGSGTGIAALINGTVDLAQSSRPMKEEEKQDVLKKRGVAVNETPVALDALAVFVNEKNSIRELSIEQIAGIYTGKLTNWRQVGRANATIVLYGRENSSGTYEYFKEHVLSKADFAPRVQTLAGTAAVINAVAKDPNSIGYGGIAYAEGVRAIAVKKDAQGPGVEPNEANVLNGKYPISRQLYFYWVASASQEIKDFVQWCNSPEGQAVVKDVGYFPLAQAPQTQTAGQ